MNVALIMAQNFIIKEIMEIIVKVSGDELREMNLSVDELKDKMYAQLDEAIMPGEEKSLSLSGYSITVDVSPKIQASKSKPA